MTQQARPAQWAQHPEKGRCLVNKRYTNGTVRVAHNGGEDTSNCRESELEYLVDCQGWEFSATKAREIPDLSAGDRVMIRDHSRVMEVIDMNHPRKYREGRGHTGTKKLCGEVIERDMFARPTSCLMVDRPHPPNDTIVKTEDGRHLCIWSGFLEKIEQGKTDQPCGSAMGWSYFSGPVTLGELGGIWMHDTPLGISNVRGSDQWIRTPPDANPRSKTVLATQCHAGRRTVMSTAGHVRDMWGKLFDAWAPWPDPAEPAPEPTSGWVEFSERYPTEADADDRGRVLVHFSDGSFSDIKVQYLRREEGKQVNWQRWCRTDWVKSIQIVKDDQ